jgi:hypothetical protein
VGRCTHRRRRERRRTCGASPGPRAPPATGGRISPPPEPWMLWWSPPLVFGKTDGEWLRRPGLDLVGVVPTPSFF